MVKQERTGEQSYMVITKALPSNNKQWLIYNDDNNFSEHILMTSLCD